MTASRGKRPSCQRRRTTIASCVAFCDGRRPVTKSTPNRSAVDQPVSVVQPVGRAPVYPFAEGFGTVPIRMAAPCPPRKQVIHVEASMPTAVYELLCCLPSVRARLRTRRSSYSLPRPDARIFASTRLALPVACEGNRISGLRHVAVPRMHDVPKARGPPPRAQALRERLTMPVAGYLELRGSGWANSEAENGWWITRVLYKYVWVGKLTRCCSEANLRATDDVVSVDVVRFSVRFLLVSLRERSPRVA